MFGAKYSKLKYWFFLIVLLSFLSANAKDKFYIYTIDGSCKFIYPGKPQDVLGAYKYANKTKEIVYSGRTRPIGLSIQQIKNKSVYDEILKKGYTLNQYKILKYNSTLKDDVHISEYVLRDKIYGDTRVGINISKGNVACEWYLMTPDKSKVSEIKSIYDKYKSHITHTR